MLQYDFSEYRQRRKGWNEFPPGDSTTRDSFVFESRTWGQIRMGNEL